MNTPQINPYELRRLQVGYDASLPRFAFDLNRAFLRVEEARALNALPVDGPGAPMDQSPKSIGGTFGDPDA